MAELDDFIKSQIIISADELSFILSHFRVQTIAQGKHLIKKGQFVTDYYFIKSGGLRIYFEKDDHEVTGWLAFENEFFTELNSLKSGQPTKFSIQAIEDTTLLSVENTRMKKLYERFPIWQQFGRQVWEEAFLKVVNGILSHQTLTAEERYVEMMKKSDLLQRVPLKQLASYLGITQTSLSRLRKNIK